MPHCIEFAYVLGFRSACTAVRPVPFSSMGAQNGFQNGDVLPTPKPLNQMFSKLPDTIFSVMTSLSLKHNSINLGQGFPDEEGPGDHHPVAAAVAPPPPCATLPQDLQPDPPLRLHADSMKRMAGSAVMDFSNQYPPSMGSAFPAWSHRSMSTMRLHDPPDPCIHAHTGTCSASQSPSCGKRWRGTQRSSISCRWTGRRRRSSRLARLRPSPPSSWAS